MPSSVRLVIRPPRTILRPCPARAATWRDTVKYVNGVDAQENPKDIPFDGVVPNANSIYPGPSALAYSADVVGINHLDIYKRKLGLDQVSAAMVRIGMLRVGPPAVVMSVSGPPAPIHIGCSYVWSANATGGVPPFTYSWKVNGATVDTGGSTQLYYTPNGPRLTITGTAIDANNTSGSASLSYSPSPEPVSGGHEERVAAYGANGVRTSLRSRVF